MSHRRFVRPLGGFAAAAGLAVASLLVAGPAMAAHVPAADIDPDETTYLGWHFDQGTGTDVTGGLELGAGANSYLLNGLVSAGEPGLPVDDATALGALISTASIEGTGNFALEIPYSVTDDENPTTILTWGTLYGTISEGTAITTASLFRSSKNLGAITAGTELPLSSFLDELDAFADGVDQIRYSGYGVYASTQDPAAVLASITFAGETTTFGLAAEEDDDDADDADEDELAETGAQDATPLAVTAGALLLLGGVLLFVRRRTAAQRDAR